MRFQQIIKGIDLWNALIEAIPGNRLFIIYLKKYRWY